MRLTVLLALATLSTSTHVLLAFDPFIIEIGQSRIEFEPETPFIAMIETISQELDGSSSFKMDFALRGAAILAKAQNTPVAPRDYEAPITQQEKDDLGFILRTLSNSSLLKIGASESALKRAGDRIEHLHPLKFLKIVFTDEELKVCIRNLHGRSWVWKEFQKGVIGSFVTEAAAQNLKSEDVVHFAQIINVNPNQILPLVEIQHWSELLDTLIASVPRKQGGKKYDM